MPFVHQNPDFQDLLRIVAGKRGLDASLVEKDYWVTHSLWSLQDKGFEVWFKGGTSLSKGFDIIKRFSEDLDLRIDPGTVKGAPAVSDWKREGRIRVEERKAYFAFLGREITVPQARVEFVTEGADKQARTADFNVIYPGHSLAGLTAPFRPFVRLEVGRAQVDPFVERDISSFVHQHCEELGILALYQDNRPRRLRCVHPLVTLIDKLDAISRFYRRDVLEADRFVRHYGDAASIISAMERLPPAGPTPKELVDLMAAGKDIREAPRAANPAFRLPDDPKREALLEAHEAIERMFWGPRGGLVEDAAAIVAWLERL